MRHIKQVIWGVILIVMAAGYIVLKHSAEAHGETLAAPWWVTVPFGLAAAAVVIGLLREARMMKRDIDREDARQREEEERQGSPRLPWM
ncbi:MAG: hypothetical protein IT210_14125 [Armatimonadetes bacterium]|nr:hypothetical protein [Armatimonadota bacterium]